MYYTCSACNLIIHGELVPLIHFGFWNVPGITGTCVRIQWNETPERLEPNTGPVGNCRRNTQLTDITEIPCSDAKLYLAPILDCYDGSILGFKMDTKKYHRFLPSLAGYPIAFFCQGQSHKWCFTSLTEKSIPDLL
jgi:hypothetical protein